MSPTTISSNFLLYLSQLLDKKETGLFLLYFYSLFFFSFKHDTLIFDGKVGFEILKCFSETVKKLIFMPKLLIYQWYYSHRN